MKLYYMIAVDNEKNYDLRVSGDLLFIFGNRYTENQTEGYHSLIRYIIYKKQEEPNYTEEDVEIKFSLSDIHDYEISVDPIYNKTGDAFSAEYEFYKFMLGDYYKLQLGKNIH